MKNEAYLKRGWNKKWMYYFDERKRERARSITHNHAGWRRRSKMTSAPWRGKPNADMLTVAIMGVGGEPKTDGWQWLTGADRGSRDGKSKTDGRSSARGGGLAYLVIQSWRHFWIRTNTRIVIIFSNSFPTHHQQQRPPYNALGSKFSSEYPSKATIRRGNPGTHACMHCMRYTERK